jgi:hypothetical protein
MKTLTKSDRKFIRLEKSRIRKRFFEVAKQEEMISQLYKKMLGEAAPVKETKVSGEMGAAKSAEASKEAKPAKVKKEKTKKVTAKKS